MNDDLRAMDMVYLVMGEEPKTCGWCTTPRKPGDPYYCSEEHRDLDHQAMEDYVASHVEEPC